MYPVYRDLRDRLGPPLWHDWQGVPRYDAFQPGHQNVYAHHEALVIVRCGSCAEDFAVGVCTLDPLLMLRTLTFEPIVLPTLENPGWIAWGDAPWHDDGGQCAGTTMVADLIAIVEYWRHDDFEWVRHPELEMVFDAH